MHLYWCLPYKIRKTDEKKMLCHDLKPDFCHAIGINIFYQIPKLSILRKVIISRVLANYVIAQSSWASTKFAEINTIGTCEIETVKENVLSSTVYGSQEFRSRRVRLHDEQKQYGRWAEKHRDSMRGRIAPASKKTAKQSKYALTSASRACWLVDRRLM